MVWFRFIFGGLMLASVFCFGAFLVTRHPGWQRWGVTILKWTVVAAFVFFAILLWQRPLA